MAETKKFKYESEWFRHTAWTKEDEADFFSHLKRARYKAQYTRIQAHYLYENEIYDAALMLLDYYFENFRDNMTERAIALRTTARIYDNLKVFGKAFEYYKQAAEFEKSFPSVTCDAWLDFAVFIVKQGKTDLFNEAKEYAERNYKYCYFPKQQYMVDAVLAVIYKSKGDTEKHEYYKERANLAAEATESPFRYHKKIGLAQRDKILDKLMK